MEHFSSVPIIKDTPTMILGMDVSHGAAGQSDVPSIAAVNYQDLLYFEWFTQVSMT